MTSSVAEVLRIEGGRVLATLIRMTGDFALAEDALQDAVVVALEGWTREGIPSNPGAWLTTVARNKALDRIRRESNRRRRETEAAAQGTDTREDPGGDDLLRLMFTCCHPALSIEAQIALTLRTVSGLATTEIARLFLVPDSTMSQRISRAKKKIADAHIPYRVPEEHELPDRLPPVLAVLYLLFTTGHHPPAGRLRGRVDLAEEAIRVGRLLAVLMPDEPEVIGLLALMLAVHARSPARIDDDEGLMLMPDQDRSRWDHDAIAEADRLVQRALRRGRVGRYQVEAAIACLHGMAPSHAETDWEQIVDLYRLLERIAPTDVVRVNRAVAEAEVSGPEAGLALLDTVEGLDRWHLYWSTRADLLRRLGRDDQAVAAYRMALAQTMNDTDRRLLSTRLAEITTPDTPGVGPRTM